MKIELKKIIPGYGLGILKFGLLREQVKDILGEPDDLDSYSYSESTDDFNRIMAL